MSKSKYQMNLQIPNSNKDVLEFACLLARQGFYD
jgi:hypothetical protein